MKRLVMLLALTLPLAAQPLAVDRPHDTPNPATNQYAAVPGFLQLPPGRVMGSSSAVSGDSHGHIWVVDRCGANDCAASPLDPVMEFDAGGKFLRAWGAGKFLQQWGGHGKGPGQFEMPHTLALDSHGRLYVGDRGNDRIQIFTQDGKYLGQLTQFGRPSGIFIDKRDVLYVTDSESREAPGYGHHPGWKRGVRIGSLKDGKVTDFIPDTDPHPDAGTTSGGEGVWVDAKGAVYSAQVEQKAVVKYVRN